MPPPRTPLLRPDRFFADQEFHGIRITVVALLVIFSLPIGMMGVGWVLQERIDGTVMVDNPDRPSTQFCENAPDSMGMGCDEPAKIERNIDAVISEAIGNLLGEAVLGVLLAISVVGGLLHVGSRLCGGSNGLPASFAIALWGLVPTLCSLLFGIASLFILIEPMTVTPNSDPAVLIGQIRADIQPIEQWRPIATGFTTLWGGVIWRFGLIHKQGLTPGGATAVAGSVALIFWLLSTV